ncbi:MAG: archaellum operon transcriptional activator EarA family protein [Candidatus Thermoplasmatota archaeon]
MGSTENNKTIEYSINLKRPYVVRALRRSEIRRKIAKHLFDISPSGNYISNIAYQINTTPTNVIGALRGLNNRYKKEESLLGLDIVEEITGVNNIKLYRITEFGKEIIELFNKDKK